MKKHYFNMIEIILAISIIAIGISSVMVLFTAGVKSTEATLKYTNLPDAAETAIAEIRALASTHAGPTGWHSNFESSFPTLGSTGWKGVKLPQFADFNSKFKTENKPEKDGKTLISDDSGNYLYRQLRYTDYDTTASADHTYETVFSAIIEARSVGTPGPVYSETDIQIANPLKPSEKLSVDKVKAFRDARDDDHVNLFRKVRRILELRVSYPADVAPELRDTKIYRIELYNDKYDGI